MSPAPTVSVVIAGVVGPLCIDDCLASLFAQKDAPDFEVIVVDCHGPENVARLAQRFHAARFLPSRQRETVPQLRLIGAEQVRG